MYLQGLSLPSTLTNAFSPSYLPQILASTAGSADFQFAVRSKDQTEAQKTIRTFETLEREGV